MLVLICVVGGGMALEGHLRSDSGACECDVSWQKGLGGCDSGNLGWGSCLEPSVTTELRLSGSNKEAVGQAQREGVSSKAEVRAVRARGPRRVGGLEELDWVRTRISLEPPAGAQPCDLGRTPDLQNCPRARLCCLEQLSLWSFVTAPLGTKTRDTFSAAGEGLRLPGPVSQAQGLAPSSSRENGARPGCICLLFLYPNSAPVTRAAKIDPTGPCSFAKFCL